MGAENGKKPNIDKRVSFRCTYLVEDHNYIKIINNVIDDVINDEIEEKIKILNGNKKEKLVFTKKFDKIGKYH